MSSFRNKPLFFDSPAVVAAVDKATRQVLSRFGSYVYTRARQSIRARKRESLPGQPPSSHTGDLKHNIFFGYDPATKSVVVGPVLLGKAGTAPAALEYGRTLPVRWNVRRRPREVGGSGEIALGRGKRMTTPGHRGIRALVVYARLRTERQAERANRLNEELYGPDPLPAVELAARPYMRPALEAELPGLPAMWANSVTPRTA